MIGRYDVERNTWYYGYFKDTRFIVVSWFRN
jgi:hypothetical protein